MKRERHEEGAGNERGRREGQERTSCRECLHSSMAANEGNKLSRVTAEKFVPVDTDASSELR